MRRTSRRHFFFGRFVAFFFGGGGILAPDSCALFRSMATACFCGFPCAISVLMFSAIVLWEVPRFSGIGLLLIACRRRDRRRAVSHQVAPAGCSSAPLLGQHVVRHCLDDAVPNSGNAESCKDRDNYLVPWQVRPLCAAPGDAVEYDDAKKRSGQLLAIHGLPDALEHDKSFICDVGECYGGRVIACAGCAVTKGAPLHTGCSHLQTESLHLSQLFYRAR